METKGVSQHDVVQRHTQESESESYTYHKEYTIQTWGTVAGRLGESSSYFQGRVCQWRRTHVIFSPVFMNYGVTIILKSRSTFAR